MSECKIEDLEIAMTSIAAEFEDEKLLNTVKAKFEQFRKCYDSERIGYCVEKYLSAELDSTTFGNCGIGRMTEYIPRFGSYFRKALPNMSEADISRLRGIIQDLILRGYLVHVLFMEESIKDSTVLSVEDLYEKWIPGIYSQSPSEMGKNLRNVFGICTDLGLKTLKNFINSHKMKGGGFLSGNKRDLIVFYYPLAGFGLRVVETGGY